ncbi:hypothetical protein LUZ60_017711 [Juncus effusus]|nr:hypothetical protein LUZ60_017711 [Juncus effusus]
MVYTRRFVSFILAIFVLFFALSQTSQGHRISDLLTSDERSYGRESETAMLLLPGGSTCERTYGFLPCSSSIVGNIFLAIVYGFFMFTSATWLSTGCEMLLQIMGPGIVGGLCLPILGSLPDALLILVSGLAGSSEDAQNQLPIGMGLLAGSTILTLTLLWGTCVLVGKCDFNDGNHMSIDMKDTKGLDLFGSGVVTDVETSNMAKIMRISILPLVVVQIPKVLNSDGEQIAVLFALILAVGLLLSYCSFQVFQPWIQKRRLAYAKHKHVISEILRHAQIESHCSLLYDNGTPNDWVIRKLFYKIDLNHNGVISQSELRAFVMGIKFDDLNLVVDEAINKIMDDFDLSNDGDIQEDEFINGISNWLLKAKRSVPYGDEFIEDFQLKSRNKHQMLTEASDEVVESAENIKWMLTKALFLVVLGTFMAAVFSNPLVNTTTDFSTATSIPSFFISFIVLPFANSSDTISCITFASRKKKRMASLTFSQIYGGVTMRNTLCLAVFLALVYIRDLTWDFTSEALIIMLICSIIGCFASFRTIFPLWTCLVAYLLYPISLLIVIVLESVFCWS